MKFVLLATVSCASLIACGTPADVAAVGSDVTQAPLSQSALSVISAKAPNNSVSAPLVTSSLTSYSYAPAVLRDSNGVTKMWFCANHTGGSGDGIFYTEAPTAQGPWTPPKEVFSAAPGQIDGLDVCDPSVIRRPDGIYLMYYGAAAADSLATSHNKAWTTIAMAQSSDGVNWTRLRNQAGNTLSVVGPANPNDPSYGAGQPSVIYDPTSNYYIMLFTDSTLGGDKLYMRRSRDFTFQNAVDALDPKGGWIPDPGAKRPALKAGADADMALVGNALITAGNGGGKLGFTAIANTAGTPFTDGVSNVSLVGDAAFVRDPFGALVITKNQAFDVMVTLSDARKNKATNDPWGWSIGDVTLDF